MFETKAFMPLKRIPGKRQQRLQTVGGLFSPGLLHRWGVSDVESHRLEAQPRSPCAAGCAWVSPGAGAAPGPRVESRPISDTCGRAEAGVGVCWQAASWERSPWHFSVLNQGEKLGRVPARFNGLGSREGEGGRDQGPRRGGRVVVATAKWPPLAAQVGAFHALSCLSYHSPRRRGIPWGNSLILSCSGGNQG